MSEQGSTLISAEPVRPAHSCWGQRNIEAIGEQIRILCTVLEQFKGGYIEKLADEHKQRCVESLAELIEKPLKALQMQFEQAPDDVAAIRQCDENLLNGLRDFFEIDRNGKDQDLISSTRKSRAWSERSQNYRTWFQKFFVSEVKIARNLPVPAI